MSRRVISFIGGKIRLHPTIGPDQTPQCLRRYLFSGRGRFGSRVSKNLLPQINRRWITFIHTEGADYKKSLSYLPLKQARLFCEISLYPLTISAIGTKGISGSSNTTASPPCIME